MWLRHSYRLVLWLVIVFGNAILIHAQDNYKFSFYNIDNGLSATTVRQVVKDKYGFYWFATQDGLNRFDGKHFIIYSNAATNPKRRLSGTDCRLMLYDGQDRLMIIHGYDGMSIIDVRKNQIIHQESNHKITKSKENIFLADAIFAGNVLAIMGDNETCYLYDINRLNVVDKIRVPISGNRIPKSIFSYNNKVYIVGNNGQLFILNPKSKSVSENKVASLINAKYMGERSQIVDNDLYYFGENAKLLFRDIHSGFDNVQTINSLFPNHADKINNATWDFYYKDSLLWMSDFEGVFSINIKNGLLNNLLLNTNSSDKDYFTNVRYIHIESDKLIICSDKGIAFGVKSIFHPISNDAYDANIQLTQVFPITNLDSIINVATNNGLFQFNMHSKRLKKVMDKYCMYLIPIEKDLYYSPSSEGASIWDNQNQKHIAPDKRFPELSNLNYEDFTKVIELSQGRFLLPTESNKGIYLWDKNNHTLRNITGPERPVTRDYMINDLHLHNGRIMVVAESEISILDTTQFEVIKSKKVADLGIRNPGIYMDACPEGDNLWVGLYGYGVALLDSNLNVIKAYGTEDGIATKGVFRVIPRDDYVIITTTNGLSILDRKQDKIRNYYKSDNLHANSFEERSAHSLGDTIFVGGVGGFTYFNLKDYHVDTTRPQLYLNSISYLQQDKLIDTSDMDVKSLRIPHDASSVKVDFAALYYQNPDRVHYEYRLDGKNWEELGKQNFIDFIGMSPGEYDLEVRAYAEPGYYSNVLSLSLDFLPKWYQSLWFKIAMIIALGSIFYGLYRWRLAQMRRVYQVRQKISQDLHDDVSSSLSSIRMYSQIVDMQPDNKEIINYIKDNTQDALEKLDDIVWNNDPKYDTLQHLIEKIQTSFTPIMNSHKIQFVLHAAEAMQANIPMRPLTRQTAYLIIKEAINNALKYSQCTEILLTIRLEGKRLNCMIQDNGIGFDTSQSFHRNGLINMQARATQAKGTYGITSSPDSGTKVWCELPM